jgi:SPP1 family predicted phage head-tail adaptor
MRAPNLSRALVLEACEQAPDGAGGFTTLWQPLGTLWAEVRPGSGREVAGVEVTLSTVAMRITVRAAPQDAVARPRAGQRFREGDRLFAILAVVEADAAGRYLTCHAREEIPA